MANMIAAYKAPRNAADVASLLKLFLEEEIGVSSNLTPKDGGHHIYVELEDGEAEEDVSVFIGHYHGAVVLSDDEMKVIDALRRKRPTFYPSIVAGFETPTDAAELLEWVRLTVDTATPVMVGYCRRGKGLDFTLPSGAEVRLTLEDDARDEAPEPPAAADSAPLPDLGTCLRLQIEPTWAAGEERRRDSRRLALDVNVMGRDAWDAIDKQARCAWTAQALDDGRVLAIRARDDYASVGVDMPEDPERVAAVRSLRGKLMDFLEDSALVSYVDCQAGGNGGATYRLTVEGEATAEDPDPIREHLVLTLATDPDN